MPRPPTLPQPSPAAADKQIVKAEEISDPLALLPQCENAAKVDEIVAAVDEPSSVAPVAVLPSVNGRSSAKALKNPVKYVSGDSSVSNTSKTSGLMFAEDTQLSSPTGDTPLGAPGSEVSSNPSLARDPDLRSTDMSTVYRIYKKEALKCAIMVGAFAVSLIHLYAYPEFVGTVVVPKDAVPAEELRFFHHGWTAMLVIFLVEFCSVGLKIWCTWHSPVLATAVAQKLEDNIGVLFGEYIVVGATYVIMGCNLMPVFLESRTSRRVYGVRYMEWTIDACGLVYLDCKVLFGHPVKKFYMAFVWSVAYMLLGLWSAIADTWVLYWVFLAGSWLTFGFVCVMLVRFLQQDLNPAQPFAQGVKPAILAFIIGWWTLYGVLFMLAFEELVPQWVEQFLWTGMDVIMKLSHTVVLMAWRGSLSDIDAVVKRHKAEAQRLVAKLTKERAVAARDRTRFLAKLTGSLDPQQIANGSSGDPPERQPLVSDDPAREESTQSMAVMSCESEGINGKMAPDVVKCWKEIHSIYWSEARTCLLLCGAFGVALVHLYIYPELFDVQVLPAADVPLDEMEFFHHGWLAMFVVFLIEAITVLLKVWSSLHQPVVARSQAQKHDGNIGALFGEYFVVGATYLIMGYNLMPVFIEQRTGRRVYGVRYMEWTVDACGLLLLDCHSLFNRPISQAKPVFVWTILYMLFGLWSAIASTWLWYAIWLTLSWLAFVIVCCYLVYYLRHDPRPLDPFGSRSVKQCILGFIITWWVLYGVLFMVAFQAPESCPQWLEQLLWTGMDVIMKLSHTVVLMAWRATQWDIDTVRGRFAAESQRKEDLADIRQVREDERQLRKQMERNKGQNWAPNPGLAIAIPDILKLQTDVGQENISKARIRGMMSPEQFAEWQRLENLGLSQAQHQETWEGQVREQTFLQHGINHIVYNPNNWMESLFGLQGRAGGSFPCVIITLVAAIVTIVTECIPGALDTITITPAIHSLVGGSVMFLVVFRTQYSFKKFWDGRMAFGSIIVFSRTLAQQCCAYVDDDELCQQMVRYIIASVVATRCHLRDERIDRMMLTGILGDAEVKELNEQANIPGFATWMVRSNLSLAVRRGATPGGHVIMDNALRALEVAISDAEMLLTPMPFMYVAHLRSFLFLYLLFLPFVLVEDLGRLMVVAVALASYLLIGLENTAVTMENPFGSDRNDLPLDLYCIKVSRDCLGFLELRIKAQAKWPKEAEQWSGHHDHAMCPGGGGDDE